jgi:hypothetical protein
MSYTWGWGMHLPLPLGFFENSKNAKNQYQIIKLFLDVAPSELQYT